LVVQKSMRTLVWSAFRIYPAFNAKIQNTIYSKRDIMPPQRQFGDLISGNRAPAQELSSTARGFIAGAKSHGGKTSDIAADIGCCTRTIRRTIQRINQTGTTSSRARIGAPAKLDDRDERTILRLARTLPAINYKKLQERAGTNVHKRTVYRLLKEHGITNWIAKKRPLLTPVNAQKRLAFALAHQHWGYTEWSKVIWSDECSFERGSGKDRKWVFRTPQQKWDHNMIQEVPKGKDLCQMVWGAFYGDGNQSPLVIMERDPESKRNGYSAISYMETLDEGLVPIYEPGLIFMQDNASIHTAIKVREWLISHGVWTMTWPPYSPDLNPIEHLWYELKKKVFELYPELEDQGNSAQALRNLQDACKEAWALISEGLMDRLVESMEDRIAAVIRAQGWQTKY